MSAADPTGQVSPLTPPSTLAAREPGRRGVRRFLRTHAGSPIPTHDLPPLPPPLTSRSARSYILRRPVKPVQLRTGADLRHAKVAELVDALDLGSSG